VTGFTADPLKYVHSMKEKKREKLKKYIEAGE